MSNGDQTSFKDKFLELQYSTLRKEIETCQNRHFRLVVGALFAVPAIQIAADIVEANGSGFLGPRLVALVILAPLPVLFLIVYVRFFQEHYAMSRCATFIKDHIETAAQGVKGWEHWLSEPRDEKIRDSEKGEINRVRLLYGTMFLLSAILAVQHTYVVFNNVAWSYWCTGPLLEDLCSGDPEEYREAVLSARIAGWTAVGIASLFYAIALLYAQTVANRLKRQVPYLK